MFRGEWDMAMSTWYETDSVGLCCSDTVRMRCGPFVPCYHIDIEVRTLTYACDRPRCWGCGCRGLEEPHWAGLNRARTLFTDGDSPVRAINSQAGLLHVDRASPLYLFIAPEIPLWCPAGGVHSPAN